MKRFAFILIAVLLVVALVGVLAACGGESAEEPQTGGEATETTGGAAPSGNAKVLRWSSPHPLGDPVVDVQVDFIEAFNAAQDQYVIELHAGGALMGMGDQFDAVSGGAVEFGEWPVAVFGSVVPEFNMAELPFSVNSIEADAAFAAEMHKIYDEILPEKYNMKPVFIFTCQGLDIISVEPVKTLEDWKGLLCQTISPVTAQVVSLLGGAGVAQDFSEGYQSLSKKVIEATLQSGSMVTQFKLYEVAKYVTRGYLTPATIGIFINADIYNEMPDDIKAIFDQCAADAEVASNEAMIEAYKQAFEDMKTNGMETYNLPKAERDKWAEKLQPYADELLGALDPAMAERIQTITQQLDQQFPYLEQ